MFNPYGIAAEDKHFPYLALRFRLTRSG